MSTAALIVQAYEDGRDRHPLDRALLLLSAAAPEAKWEELASLPVGRRDARLLELRERLFGRRLRFSSRCPSCDEKVEAEIDARSLHQEPAQGEHEVQLGTNVVRFRLPDSRDLAAVIDLPPEKAGASLLERCVTSGSLQPGMLDALDRAMAEADAQAEIAFSLSCPNCARAWEDLLDPPSFLWAELSAEAQRLFREVHALAAAYGWREAEILDLSPARRRTYLELVGA